MKTTTAQIKTELNARYISFPKNSRKASLEAILNASVNAYDFPIGPIASVQSLTTTHPQGNKMDMQTALELHAKIATIVYEIAEDRVIPFTRETLAPILWTAFSHSYTFAREVLIPFTIFTWVFFSALAEEIRPHAEVAIVSVAEKATIAAIRTFRWVQSEVYVGTWTDGTLRVRVGQWGFTSDSKYGTIDIFRLTR
jgi:hypothetical protein